MKYLQAVYSTRGPNLSWNSRAICDSNCMSSGIIWPSSESFTQWFWGRSELTHILDSHIIACTAQVIITRTMIRPVIVNWDSKVSSCDWRLFSWTSGRPTTYTSEGYTLRGGGLFVALDASSIRFWLLIHLTIVLHWQISTIINWLTKVLALFQI
jgi:hypothetical protein